MSLPFAADGMVCGDVIAVGMGFVFGGMASAGGAGGSWPPVAGALLSMPGGIVPGGGGCMPMVSGGGIGTEEAASAMLYDIFEFGGDIEQRIVYAMEEAAVGCVRR